MYKDSFKTLLSILSGGVTDSVIFLFLIVWRTTRVFSIPKAQFYIHTVLKGFRFSTPSPLCAIYHILMGVKQCPTVVLTCIPPTDSWDWVSFHMLIGHISHCSWRNVCWFHLPIFNWVFDIFSWVVVIGVIHMLWILTVGWLILYV
jgi:hypothetical protein